MFPHLIPRQKRDLWAPVHGYYLAFAFVQFHVVIAKLFLDFVEEYVGRLFAFKN